MSSRASVALRLRYVSLKLLTFVREARLGVITLEISATSRWVFERKQEELITTPRDTAQFDNLCHCMLFKGTSPAGEGVVP